MTPRSVAMLPSCIYGAVSATLRSSGDLKRPLSAERPVMSPPPLSLVSPAVRPLLVARSTKNTAEFGGGGGGEPGGGGGGGGGLTRWQRAHPAGPKNSCLPRFSDVVKLAK